MSDEAGIGPVFEEPSCLCRCRWLKLLFLAVTILFPVGAACVALSSHSRIVGFLGPAEGWLITIGKATGLGAATLLLMQFVLSARLKLLDRLFGLDRLLRVHRLLGATAGVLACMHPLFLYASATYEIGPVRSSAWPVYLGAAALVLLGVVICTSLWRVFLELPYGAWLWVHRMVFVVVVAAVVHAMRIGSDLRVGWTRVMATAALTGYAGLFIWAKLIRPLLLGGRRFTVTAVNQLNHNVCRIELALPEGAAFRRFPGQFAFLKIRSRNVPAEEHPFTISSGPAQDGHIQFTIKASGDFTRLISKAAPGDLARVDGPYGLFSYALKTGPAQPLVMIAGGVGVTPMLSMLCDLSVREPDRQTTLIWANRTEEDIFARPFLEEVSAKMANLTVHHVLSRQADWPGEKGRLDRAKLDRLLPSIRRDLQYFLCGPGAMMDSVKSYLLKLGARRRRIHTERFSF